MDDLILTADDIDFREFSDEPRTAGMLKPASSWLDDVIKEMRTPRRLQGDCLSMPKTHDCLRFRPGEVTLWLGMNGHGKSLLTSQMVLDFAMAERKSCIASFEMSPQSTIARMVRQAAGNATPPERFIRRFHQFMKGRVWIYNQMGSCSLTELAGIIRYAARAFEVNHFVVDSLMKVVDGEEDYSGQKRAVGTLTQIALDFKLHIHLVHHSRKLMNELVPPGKMDAKGSGAITDQVDQIVTVWRNKKKEFAKRAGEEVDENSPDALAIVDKNRHGEWEGRIPLFFHQPGNSFNDLSKSPRRWDIESKTEDEEEVPFAERE